MMKTMLSLMALMTIYRVSGQTSNCVGEDACKDGASPFTACVSGGTCLFNCIGEKACAGEIEFNANGATSLIINCVGKGACSGSDAEVICGTATTCTIVCDGEDSCKSAVLGTATCSSTQTGEDNGCPGNTNSPTSAVVASPTATIGPTFEPTANPTVEPTAPTASTTPAPVAVSPDSVSESASGSSSSSDEVQNAVIAQHLKDMEQAEEQVEGQQTETNGDIVISLSDSALYNLWGMAILFILVNGSLCFCYYQRKRVQRTEPDQIP